MTTPNNENSEEILFSLNSLPMWLSSLTTSSYVSKHYMLDLKNPNISRNQSNPHYVANSSLTIDKYKTQVSSDAFNPVEFEKEKGLPYDYSSPKRPAPVRKVRKKVVLSSKICLRKEVNSLNAKTVLEQR